MNGGATPRIANAERGRSINMALAARGIRGLKLAGVLERVMPLAIPMRGRMVHELDGSAGLQMYGVRPEEVIYSISRADLNRVLIEAAAESPNVSLQFGQLCLGLAHEKNVLEMRDEATGRIYHIAAQPSIATDGAGSDVRDSLLGRQVAVVREEPLEHDYKELTIPALNGKHALDPNTLHIWPRGGFMLIALPNQDGTFTATLFLARLGDGNSFAALNSPGAVEGFFARELPSARALMPDVATRVLRASAGFAGHRVHAGMASERGCIVVRRRRPRHRAVSRAGNELRLRGLRRVDAHDGPASALGRVVRGLRTGAAPEYRRHREDGAGELQEMRQAVLDPEYRRKKREAEELERKDPNFIPRYSMVMFHPEIPYRQIAGRTHGN